MATFGARLESLIGGITTDADMNDWLTSGAKVLVDKIPMNKAERVATLVTDAGSGIALTDKRLLRAHKGGYPAPIVSGGIKTQMADSNSLEYAVTKSPRAYVENTKLYVLPSGGTGIVIPYPTVLYSESAVTNFPAELYEAMILYAAVFGLQQLYNLYVTTDVAAVTAPTAPTTPPAPAFSYTDASGTTVAVTSITAPTSITRSLTAPPGTIAATTIDISALTLPTYTIPVGLANFTNAETYIATDEDLDQADTELKQQQTKIGQLGADIQNAGAEYKKNLDIYRADVDKTVLNAQLLQQKLIEDVKLSQQQLALDAQQTQQAATADESLSQQNLVNVAGLLQDKLLDDARRADNIDVANKAKALEQQVAQYIQTLQKYQADIGKYSSELQGYTNNVSVVMQKHQGLLIESANLQKLFDRELALYLGA